MLLQDLDVSIVASKSPSDEKSDFLPVFRSGSCAERGPKQYMEDEHLCLDNLIEHLGATAGFPSPGAFYGVSMLHIYLTLLHLFIDQRNSLSMDLLFHEMLANGRRVNNWVYIYAISFRSQGKIVSRYAKACDPLDRHFTCIMRLKVKIQDNNGLLK